MKSTDNRDAVSCFIVEHNSFVEVKDCFIKSINDKLNFDSELDTFFRQKTRGSNATNGVRFASISQANADIYSNKRN